MAMTLAAPGMSTRGRVFLWLLTWLLSGAVLSGLCVLYADRPIATWSHDVLHRPLVAVDITKVAGAVHMAGAALAVLVAALVARLSGRSMGPWWRTAMAAAVATLLAMFAVTFVKFGFGRLWPETWVHNNPSWIANHQYGFWPLHGGEGYESFPSGHTARITAPFAVLWHRFARLRVLWVLPPVVIALALLAADFHFLGDCIAGAYVGVVCAAGVMMLIK